MNHVTSLFCLARYRKWLVDWLLAWLDIWLTECISRQRMIPCILTDISTCHCLTIEIRWDPGGLTDISSFCQTAYNLNTGLVIQSITTLVMKLWHVCESLHANKCSFFEMEGTLATTDSTTEEFFDSRLGQEILLLFEESWLPHGFNPSLSGYRGKFLVGKAAGAWTWLLTSI
jgi:hypothetical protein